MSSCEASRISVEFRDVGRGLFCVVGGCGIVSRLEEGSSWDDEMRLGCTAKLAKNRRSLVRIPRYGLCLRLEQATLHVPLCPYISMMRHQEFIGSRARNVYSYIIPGYKMHNGF
jgi:hypothetical protein